MRAALSTLRLSFANVLVNRASFATQCTFMIANNITWVIFWAFFFGRVGHVRGWALADVYVLIATAFVAAGLSIGVFANGRHLGKLISDGSIDEVMVLPTGILSQILCRRVEPTNIGDVISGIGLFLIAGNPTPLRTLTFIAAALLASVIFTGFVVFFGSLTFFSGGEGEQAEIAFQALVLFSMYPVDLFGGPMRVILFTLVPAAFITGVPASLVHHFNAGELLLLAAVAVFMVGLANAVFRLGLRRYASGSLWTHR